MKLVKNLGFAGALVAAAIVGGTLMSAAFAAPGGPGSPQAATLADDATNVYCQTFLSEFAKQLGVDESKLLPAAKAAADAVVDKALADGKITQATADALKQRIANADPTDCAFLGRWAGIAHGGVRLEIGADAIQAAASALHLSVADLRTQIRDGKSLKEIAAQQKVDYTTLTTAIHNAVKADLDKLVKAGTIAQAREDEVLANLDQALKDGKLWNGPGMRPGFGFGFGHGMRGFPGGGQGPFAPPASPSASSGSSS